MTLVKVIWDLLAVTHTLTNVCKRDSRLDSMRLLQLTMNNRIVLLRFRKRLSLDI